jgi:uncharacterized protein YkwD
MRGRAALIVVIGVAPTLLAASVSPEVAGAAGRRRAPARPTAPVRRAGDRAGPAGRLLDLINQDRMAARVAPLALHQELGAIAAGFSGRLAQEGALRHNQGFLSPPSLARLGATKLGENVGLDRSLEGAHRAFMASPHHRANILDPDFGRVGISVLAAGGALYVVEDFAAVPRPAAPVSARARSGTRRRGR